MTVFRTFDASNINRIANLPEVHTNLTFHLPDKGPLDFQDCAEKADRYVLLTDGGDAGALIEMKTPVVFDCHSIFGPECRGRFAIESCREMVDWLFANTTALILTGATPVEFRAARIFNKRVGFKSDGIRTLDGAYWQHDFEHHHIFKSEWPGAA